MYQYRKGKGKTLKVTKQPTLYLMHVRKFEKKVKHPAHDYQSSSRKRYIFVTYIFCYIAQ